MDDLAQPEVWDDDSGVVEVSLKTGELNSLVLTAQVRVNWRDELEAAQTIRRVTQVLLKASPVAELKGMDLEYFNEFYEIGIDAKNNFAWLPKFSVEVRRKQEEVRKKLNHGAAPPIPPAAAGPRPEHPGS